MFGSCAPGGRDSRWHSSHVAEQIGHWPSSLRSARHPEKSIDDDTGNRQESSASGPMESDIVVLGRAVEQQSLPLRACTAPGTRRGREQSAVWVFRNSRASSLLPPLLIYL